MDDKTAGDQPDENGITPGMRQEMWEMISLYGDASVNSVVEKAYLAMRELDPAFFKKPRDNRRHRPGSVAF